MLANQPLHACSIESETDNGPICFRQSDAAHWNANLPALVPDFQTSGLKSEQVAKLTQTIFGEMEKKETGRQFLVVPVLPGADGAVY